MSYYTGQGDYYSGKGDPGLFSFVGKALGAVGGFLPGPLGGIAKKVGGLLAPSAPAYSAPAPTMLPLQIPSGAGGMLGRFRTAAQALIPGGVEPGMGMACAPGYHLDKTTKTKCVRNRSMNVANPKALRRAIRREAGFVTLAKQALRGSGYTFKRTSYPKRAKRRR